ncbi:MAG: hypothetical protein IPM64_16495 [Phycisphaerales bacterium]|nr:hypothetical protein [Phycisphaerales bacterium]
MVFRMQVPIAVERPDGEFATAARVEVELLYQAGRWRGQCRQPPVATGFCDTMEAALVATAKDVAREWNAVGLESARS